MLAAPKSGERWQRHSVQSYLASGLDSVAGQTEAGSLDLSLLANPTRLTDAARYEQVLLPALEAGWLDETEVGAGLRSERQLEERVYQLEPDQLRAWTDQVLRAHPWAPGVKIPTFPEFVHDYLAEPGLSAYQERVFADAIGLSAVDWFVKPRRVNVVFLCWGKGSGKDTVSAWLAAYVGFTVPQMRNPWWHFRMPEGDHMDCVNVAQDRNSAKGNYFDRLARYCQSECFEPLLDRRPGKDIQTDSIVFRKRVPGRRFPVDCIRLLSLHSGNEGAEGKNTFCFACDEIDAMCTQEGNANGEKMFKTLRTSSRYGALQLGLVFSYPRSLTGIILSKLKECANRGGRAPEYYGDLAPTYRVLPFKCYLPVRQGADGEWHDIPFTECDGTEWYTNADRSAYVPYEEREANMAQTYRDDPETFRSMYECKPPAAEDAFISMPGKIDDAVKAYLQPVAEVEHTTTEVRTQDGKTHRYVARLVRNIILRPDTVYFLGGDAGISQDSFALAMFHMVSPRQRGFCCPACWGTRRLRYAKHYKPRPLPVNKLGKARHPDNDGWRPDDWRCDNWGTVNGCVGLPSPKRDLFWGVCMPAGARVMRPTLLGYDDQGDPVYERDAAGQEVLQEVYQPELVEDLLIEWPPDKTRELTVDFQSVEQVVMDLNAAAQQVQSSIGGALFDRWQAEHTIQRLRLAGIPAEAQVMSNPAQLGMYRELKTVLYNNLISLLPDQDRARTQLKEVQLLNGTRIDHPKVSANGGPGQKDLCDAEALAVSLCCSPKHGLSRIDLGYSDEPQKVMARQAREIHPAGIVANALRGR